MDLERIRTELLRTRAELIARTQTPVETAKGDEADLATMAQNKERVLWLTNDARVRLVAIDQALARMEQGTYGVCVDCRRPIPDERLHAMPTTPYCVDCQSKLGRRTRR